MAVVDRPMGHFWGSGDAAPPLGHGYDRSFLSPVRLTILGARWSRYPVPDLRMAELVIPLRATKDKRRLACRQRDNGAVSGDGH